jgi:hypothetical protein
MYVTFQKSRFRNFREDFSDRTHPLSGPSRATSTLSGLRMAVYMLGEPFTSEESFIEGCKSRDRLYLT